MKVIIPHQPIVGCHMIHWILYLVSLTARDYYLQCYIYLLYTSYFINKYQISCLDITEQ
jgi:hypothetical protein